MYNMRFGLNWVFVSLASDEGVVLSRCFSKPIGGTFGLVDLQ